MKKFLQKNILLVALVVIILLLLNSKWLPAIKNIFKAQPVVIDNTPILIKEINELAQLCTITAFDEVVADSAVVRMKSGLELLVPDISPFGSLPVAAKKIVIIGKGKVVAGVDLKKLNDKAVFAMQDSISVLLPQAEIFDVIMNPSDFETFSETGDWSNEAVTAVKIKAREKIKENALRQNILRKANERSILLIENFLRSFGFTKITVKSAA